MHRTLAALAIGLALCRGAAADPWTRLVRPQDGFEVEFSGPVAVAPTDLAPAIRPLVVDATTYQQTGADFIFAVGVQRHKRTPALDRAVDASFATLRCAGQARSEPLPVRGARARELRGEGCLGGEHTAVLRHYTRGRSVYQVLAIHPAAREPEARRFLDSFRLIEPAVGSLRRRGKG